MIKCCVCGKFCVPVDSSTPFGGYLDTEPPDSEYYCAKCAKKEKQYFITHKWLPCNWRPAKWEYEVAKILGFIRIGPLGVAWSMWHNPNNVMPADYEEV